VAIQPKKIPALKNQPHFQTKTNAKAQVQSSPSQSKVISPATFQTQLQPGKPQIIIEFLPGGVKLEMLPILAGSFIMGSNKYSEEPPHRVTLHSFYLGKYPVTQKQWQAVMGTNPSGFKGDLQRPVELVSWNDCQAFCKKLSILTNKKYRLPSEAEWEYACRAGTKTNYYFGDNEGQLREYAQFGVIGGTCPVGSKKSNPWGLFDMYGNVWEWCEDDWHNNYDKAPTNGTAWNNPSRIQRKVLRGGSWDNIPQECRSAKRLNRSSDHTAKTFGFRLALG
jgi:formylglycine-generating enzyme required for sulfatase activity